MRKKWLSMLLLSVMVLGMLAPSMAAAPTQPEPMTVQDPAPLGQHDTIPDSGFYRVTPLEGGADQPFAYDIPEGGATVLVFFSAGCGNSRATLRSMDRCGWITDPKVNVVCIESYDHTAEETRTFLQEAVPDHPDRFRVYTGGWDLQFAYIRAYYGESSVSWPFAVMLSEEGGVPCVQYCFMGRKDAEYEYAPFLAELVPTVKPPVIHSTPVTGTRDYTMAGEVAELVNVQRKQAGLTGVSMHAKLTELAMQRAEENALYYSHTRPDGRTCFTILDGQGFSGRMAENIACGYRSSAQVMEGWMNSTGHRQNILTGSFGYIGVGCYENNGVCYWVQLFSDGTADPAENRLTGPVDTTPTIRVAEKWFAPYEENGAMYNVNQGYSYFTTLLYPLDYGIRQEAAPGGSRFTLTRNREGAVCFLAAAYDSTGRMLGQALVNAGAGTETVTLELTHPAGAALRAFVLDPDTLAPLRPAWAGA